MKQLSTIALVLLTTCSAFAQDAIQPLPKPTLSKEIGMFGHVGAVSNNSGFSMGGLQYKHWHNERVGFRVIAGYGQYATLGPDRYNHSSDTTFIRNEDFRFNLPMLGFGLEAQRHFYKNIYFFAAVEVRGGYGSGTADTSTRWTTSTNASSYQTLPYKSGRDVNLTMLGLAASIGAKAQWKRLVVGLEMLPFSADYTQISGDVHRSGLFDFNLWSTSHRVSLSYRF